MLNVFKYSHHYDQFVVSTDFRFLVLKVLGKFIIGIYRKTRTKCNMYIYIWNKYINFQNCLSVKGKSLKKNYFSCIDSNFSKLKQDKEIHSRITITNSEAKLNIRRAINPCYE